MTKDTYIDLEETRKGFLTYAVLGDVFRAIEYVLILYDTVLYIYINKKS